MQTLKDRLERKEEAYSFFIKVSYFAVAFWIIMFGSLAIYALSQSPYAQIGTHLNCLLGVLLPVLGVALLKKERRKVRLRLKKIRTSADQPPNSK